MAERIVKGIWIPIEIWEADDLSWNEKILLMEIDSYTTKGKDCFISDEYIATLLGINVINANRNVASLIKKGYIKKTRFDGRRRYLESTIYDRADLSQKIGQTYQKRQHTNNNILNISIDKSIDNIEPCKFNFKKSLINLGVSEEVATAWMQVRKTKKATNTQIAFNKVAKEIEKSGLSPDECIRKAVENSWSGFDSSWLQKHQPNFQSPKKSVLQHNMEVYEELKKRSKLKSV